MSPAQSAGLHTCLSNWESILPSSIWLAVHARVPVQPAASVADHSNLMPWASGSSLLKLMVLKMRRKRFTLPSTVTFTCQVTSCLLLWDSLVRSTHAFYCGTLLSGHPLLSTVELACQVAPCLLLWNSLVRSSHALYCRTHLSGHPMLSTVELSCQVIRCFQYGTLVYTVVRSPPGMSDNIY